jgi:uncharacterized protein YoxC
MYTPYEIFKFWMPVISGFAMVIKAYTSTKKSVTEFAERLLNNHLAGIETATVSTEALTKQTNVLLKDSSGKIDMLQATVADHNEKDLQVWAAVTQSLTILAERTRACNPSRAKKSAKRK